MSEVLTIHIAEKCCMSIAAVEDLIDRDLVYEDASGVIRVAGTGVVVYGQVGLTVSGFSLGDPRFAPVRI